MERDNLTDFTGLSLRSDLEIVSGHLISKNMLRFSRNSGKLGFFDITMHRKVKKSGGTELKEKISNDLFSLTSVPLNLENRILTYIYVHHVLLVSSSMTKEIRE
jgi:hypothetical protein